MGYQRVGVTASVAHAGRDDGGAHAVHLALVIEDHDKLALMAVELHEARRFRVLLVAVLLPALALQAFTFFRLVATDAGWTASVVATFVSIVLVLWTWVTSFRIRRLEDEVEP